MSSEVTTTATGCLEIRRHDRSKESIRLIACPFCDHEFTPWEPRWKHILDEHDPEDAGLTPLGEIKPDHDAPLFGGVEQ